MTLQETATIMDILTAAYPHFYGGKNAPDVKSTLSLWAAMFADDDVQLVAAAVKAIIVSDTREFPPTIATVKEKIYTLCNQEEMSEAEAWALVSKALKNSGYEAKKEFDRLPKTLQKIVGSPNQLHDWSMMSSETVQSVVASNFQRSYKVIQKREKEAAKLPDSVLALVSGLSNKLAIGDGTNDEI